MSKPTLRLLSTKAVKKKYTTFYVFLCDESVFEFDLDKHEVTREDDWVNVEKLDSSEMECFQVSNILRVKFKDVTDKKITMVKSITTTPPDAA